MKNYKRKEKSLYELLVKNYIIFTLVLIFLILSIYFLEMFIEQSIIQPPKVNRPIGKQDLLTSGEYEKLSLKKLLGSAGYFEILDTEGNVLYSESEGGHEHYTPEEILYIPEYDSSKLFSATVYTMKDGKKQTLVTESIYERDTGYREDIGYMILDEELKVIQNGLSFNRERFTERELAFLTLRSDAEY